MYFLNDNKHIGPKPASSHAGSSGLFGWSLMWTQQLSKHIYKKPFAAFFLWVCFLKSFGQFVILQEQEDAWAPVINMPV